jgi:hypothetical protein
MQCLPMLPVHRCIIFHVASGIKNLLDTIGESVFRGLFVF